MEMQRLPRRGGLKQRPGAAYVVSALHSTEDDRVGAETARDLSRALVGASREVVEPIEDGYVLESR
jgi:hypothetical protein